MVGAGASGLVAALAASGRGRSCIVLEQNDRPGAKLSLTGGGRCNILPSPGDPPRWVTGSNRNRLASVLKAWSPGRAMAFFEEETGMVVAPDTGGHDEGKLYPRGTDAAGVVARLVGRACEAGAEFRFGARVESIEPSGGAWLLRLRGGELLEAGRVVLATGGRSMPGTGASGWGYRMAAALGHTVREVYPALVPLSGGDPGFARLAGVSVRVTLTASAPNGRVRSTGPLLFTHVGFSGPAVLDASHAVTGPGGPAEIRVDWASAGEEGWREVLSAPRGTVSSAISALLPARLAALLAGRAGVEPSARIAELSGTARRRLLDVLCSTVLPVSGCEGWDRAETTGGGVALEEVRPHDLSSTLHGSLHFCGEVLDVFGPVGGWNLYWAWLTGRSAGAG